MKQMYMRKPKRLTLLCIVAAIPVIALLRHLHSQQFSYVLINREISVPCMHHQHSDRCQETEANVSSNLVKDSRHWHLERNKGQVDKRWSSNDENYLRCSVHTVGCFEPTKDEDQHSWIYYRQSLKNRTVSQCFQACSERSKRKYEMVGVKDGVECICAHYLNFSSLINEDYCNDPCLTNQTSSCAGNGKQYTMVYQLTGQCTAVSDINVQDSKVGCFRLSSSWDDGWLHYVSEDDLSSESCILNCEIAGFPLAAPANRRSCYCGHMTHGLSQSSLKTHCSTTTSEYIQLYKTLIEDRRCGRKRFLKPSEFSRKIGLISFPGSGNTWTRHLVEAATGVYTGSAYSTDWGLLSGGFMGELLPANSSKVSVIKSHSSGMHGLVRIDAVINVYRNPYDALLAEFKRLSGGHVGIIDQENFNQTAFKKFVIQRAQGWRHLTRASAKNNIPKLLIPFEHMVIDPVKYAEKMARFILGDKVDENDLKERLLCLKVSSAGGFKRPKQKLDFDPYDDEMKTAVNLNIDMLAKDLEKEGLGMIPDYRRAISD